MKEKLISIGFIYYPFKRQVADLDFPIEHELFGQYIYHDPRAKFILEINANGWFLYDGRPTVDKLYYEAKDVSLDYMVRLLIRFSQEQMKPQKTNKASV